MRRHLTNNFFLALLPQKQAAFAIDELANRERAERRMVGPTLGSLRYHVTLHSLGRFDRVPANLIAAIDEAIAPLAASAKPFAVRFDQALSFDTGQPKRPFVLSNREKDRALLTFRRALGTRLGLSTSTFTPHITMLYDVKCVPEYPVPAVKWTATELVLVRSYVGLGKHEHIARWPFLGNSNGASQMDFPLPF